MSRNPAIPSNPVSTDALLAKSSKIANGSPNPLSFARMLKGIVTGNWNGCESEYKTLSTSNAAGGYTLPLSVSSEVIDLARAKSVCMDAGVRTLVLNDGTTRIPKVTAGPTGTWKAENDALSATDITFGAIDFVPKTLAAVVRCSIELFEDSKLINEVILQTLMASLGQQLDAAILRANGSGAPTGIRYASGVTLTNAATGAGAPISRSLISQACESIWTANGTPNAVIMSPREYGLLDRLVDDNDQPLGAFPSYNQLSKHVTSSIPTNIASLHETPTNTTSEVYVGDFSQCVLGVRTDWTVEASRVAGDAFDKMQVAVRIYGRYDVAVLQPSHFVVLKNVSAS